MRFEILTIFPNIFDSYFNESILKRAREKKLIDIRVHNIRDWSEDRHKKVDDTPYGGGPGMVMKVEPIYNAVRSVRRHGKAKTRVIVFGTRGNVFDAKTARRLARYDQLILLCGRYEGIDERVAAYVADEEISVGDFVLSGGELPAMMLVETISRFIPGVLGKFESLEEIKGSYPVYTKPEAFTPPGGSKKKAWKVPAVLRSGNHAKIEAWRKKYGQDTN